MEQKQQPLYLPKLRHNLILIESDLDSHGVPTCLIHDKIANQYYKISWKEYQILKYWQHGMTSEQLAGILNDKTTLHVTKEDITNFLKYLSYHNLFELPPESAANALLKKQAMRSKQILKARMKSIFFQRWRLVNPDLFLDKTLHLISWLFSWKTIYFLVGLLILNFILLVSHWSEFIYSFSYFFNWTGLLYFFIALGIIKVIHELGHAYAAKYQGCHVTNIGIAFLFIIFPILYTDVSDSWRLPKHKQRLLIDAGGVTAEISVAILLSFIWFFLDDGPLRSSVFMLATASWVMSVFINLNPFIRYDGYYILSDLLHIKNLQSNSFKYANWWIRHHIWGMDLQKPINVPQRQERILVTYAFLAWIYRFFLFLGITLLIYYVFFKALGLLLFLFMFISLIAGPIVKESYYVWNHRGEICMNKNLIILLTISLLLLAILFIPWKFNTTVPAIIKHKAEVDLYLHQSGLVNKVLVKAGDTVQKDQLMAIINSSQLDNEIKQTLIELKIIKSRLSSESERSDELGYQQASEEELNAKQTKLAGFLELKKKLSVKAPISGRLVYVNRDLKAGSYLGKDDLLFEIVDPSSGFEVSAYVPANIVQYINWEKTPYFISDEIQSFEIPLNITNINLTRTKYLDELYLASTAEGEIPVEYNKYEKKISVKDVYYKVLLNASPNPKEKLQLNKATIGHVYFKVHSYSLFNLLWRKIFGTILKETNF